MKHLFSSVVLLLIFNVISAQVQDPINWNHQVRQLSENEYQVTFKADIDEGWHLYGTNIPEGGPIATSLFVEENESFSLIGKLKPLGQPHVKYDESFQMDIGSFEHEATFMQNVQLNNSGTEISGYVEFMCCNDATCLPPNEYEFTIQLGDVNSQTETDKSSAISTESNGIKAIGSAEGVNAINTENAEDVKIERIEPFQDVEPKEITGSDKKGEEDKSLWVIFLISMGAGLLGLLTPCVYPMIPMTISFFMQGGQQNKSKAVFNGLFFGVSIIAVYTLIGLIVAVTKSDFTSALNTHWIPNVIFFALFIAFAMSFFGLFEIVLPTGLANRVDKQVDKGGLLGPFFMALTTVIVSFSCTGPIVGSLLVKAVQGEILEPVIGMFGFGLVFALPFTLFAIFPGMVKGLPKSGGWLNAVKVVLGFIVLAFSFKFISNIDQAYHLNLISRQIFVAIWVVIFGLMGLYLLGKLKFSHDSDLPYISVWRLFFAIASFTFALWLLPGLWGAPLSSISSFLPPASEETAFMTPTSNVSGNESDELCFEPKYAEKFHLPYGLNGYFTLEEGIKCAKEQNKPIFLDFKGHFCSNCKKMEGEIWSEPDVLKMLREEFVIVALYTDDKTKLPEDQWITGVDGKTKKTIGKINENLEIQMFGTNTIPLYAILNTNGKPVNDLTFGYVPNKNKFIDFMNKGIEDFNQ